MRLCYSRAIASGVTECTNGLYVVVVLSVVSAMMVILVSALALRPDVSAIRAWQAIRMGPPARPHFDIDPLPGLFLIARSRSVWRGAELPRGGRVCPRDRTLFSHFLLRARPGRWRQRGASRARPHCALVFGKQIRAVLQNLAHALITFGVFFSQPRQQVGFGLSFFGSSPPA